MSCLLGLCKRTKLKATSSKGDWRVVEEKRESSKEKTAVASVHLNVGQAAGQDTHNSTRGSKKRSLKEIATQKIK